MDVLTFFVLSALLLAVSARSLVDDVHRFNDWVQQWPTRQCLRASISPDYRLTARSTCSLAKGDVHTSVPFSFILNAENFAQHAPEEAEVIKRARIRDDNIITVIFLLVERSKGDESKFSPYLSLLPQRYDMGSMRFWNDEEIEYLKGTVIYDELRHELRASERRFEHLRKQVFDPNPHLFPEQQFHVDLFHWANAIVESRTIWLEGRRNLVPLLDLINCRIGPEEREMQRTQRNNVNNTADTRAIQMLHISDEVFDNYAQPNSVYLRYHGFMLESNHADCVDIAIVCPRQATSRLRALYNMGLIQSLATRFCIVASIEFIPAPLLWTLLAVFDRNFSIPKRPRMSPKMRYRSLKFLEQHIASRLSGFMSNVQGDLELLKHGNLQPRNTLAVKQRLYEKQELATLQKELLGWLQSSEPRDEL